YFKGGSASLWLKHIDLEGMGDLMTLTEAGRFPWFVDEEGNWTTRSDVTYWETRTSKEEFGDGGPLTVTSNGGKIGPEVAFGYVMGAYHDEPVLLIESSMGNRSLAWDFRPPSSGPVEGEENNKWVGLEYDLLVKGVHKTLKNIDKVVPDYQGQGYEIAGFAWWQGHKDKGISKGDYEQHLVNLIRDLRKEFDAPEMRAVVATVGFNGHDMGEDYRKIHAAQMAVGDPLQRPELAGTVASVDTLDFWRQQGYSPKGAGHHYNHNAETYVLVGDSMGRAMVRLMGGTAEPLPVPPAPDRHPLVEKIYSDRVVQSHNKSGPNMAPEQYRKMGQALKPIVMAEMIPNFIDTAFSDRSRKLRGLPLRAIAIGTPPQRDSLDIQSQLDTLIDFYDVAGIQEYVWRPFGPENMRHATWHYFSFDPPEEQDLGKSDRYREITFPKGMENWYEPDFDPAAAGWKMGEAP
ncbi:MAG: sialate O-acetylesterase, partial [Phycisphaeraceae bacterium]|nr:sialate O-acetylesterase [Phycisphaeraceae bacterium]